MNIESKQKIISPSFSLEDYTEAILPIIKLCLREKVENQKSYKKLLIWYIYKQIFYSFIDFMDLRSICKVSSRAVTEYQKIDSSGDLRMRKWSEQPAFDKGRQKGIFHLEHVYTGDMFRRAVESLPKKDLTTNKLVELVQKNYCVAWILKEENKHLPRSNRGKSLEDALEIYSKVGINLT